MIELRGRLIVFLSPVRAAIEGNRGAAVVSLNHAPGVSGIDPKPVVVAMRNFDFVKRVAAIGGAMEVYIENVDGVGVFGIGNHVHVIPSALGEAVIGIDELPGGPAII